MPDGGGDGGSDTWAFSEGKDWKDGRHRRENSHVLSHAGEVRSPRTRQALTALRGAYERAHERGWLAEGFPAEVEETKLYRDLMAHHATEGFTKAVQYGEPAQIRHYVGSQENEPDVSGIRVLRIVEEIVTRSAPMIYIFGHMGNGKTMMGSLLGELWELNQSENALIATNSRTLPAADEWISTWPELRDWMEEPEEEVLAGNVPPKLFIFDEASSNASGRGSDGYDASTKLAVLCYKIRKYGGGLFIIGHDGKDVAPAVREMCVAFHKTGTKTGRFYHDVNNRKGRNPITDDLKGIPLPDPSWQPNTNDVPTWSWSDSTGEDSVEHSELYNDMATWTAIRCKEEGMTNKEAAKFVPFSRETVRTRWKEYSEEGQHADTLAAVEEVFG